ncbi:cobalamin-dependent protein, partial [Myxococcota bacterium]|nr:cobalamin-dependent protein [Myxococcota bacterium]
QEYQEAVFETDRERALAVVERALGAGLTPEQVVFEVVVPGVETMMRSIAADFDANLAQHFMTAQITSEITDRMVPLFARPPRIVGRIVIGTARGDLHSLGKRILIGCLRALMVESIDLGVNVAAERFVDEAVKHEARVIGVSAMMMHTAQGPEGPRGVRRILEERGLDRRIKLVVGGAPFRFDPELAFAVGADAWAPDGITAGRVIVSLMGGTAS